MLYYSHFHVVSFSDPFPCERYSSRNFKFSPQVVLISFNYKPFRELCLIFPLFRSHFHSLSYLFVSIDSEPGSQTIHKQYRFHGAYPWDMVANGWYQHPLPADELLGFSCILIVHSKLNILFFPAFISFVLLLYIGQIKCVPSHVIFFFSFFSILQKSSLTTADSLRSFAIRRAFL